MSSEQREPKPLTERELDRISAGLVCDQTGQRMEASVQLGKETLVIWATSGSHGNSGCSGVYWKVP